MAFQKRSGRSRSRSRSRKTSRGYSKGKVSRNYTVARGGIRL